MSVMLFGRVMLVRPVQSENAPSPMVVTLSGKVMLVRPVQSLNASSPMVVMLFPNPDYAWPLQNPIWFPFPANLCP